MAKTLKEARQTRGPDEAWDNRSLPGTVSPMTLRSSHVVQHMEAPGVGKENPPAQSGGQSVAESVQPQEKPPAPTGGCGQQQGDCGSPRKEKASTLVELVQFLRFCGSTQKGQEPSDNQHPLRRSLILACWISELFYGRVGNARSARY